MPSLRDRSLNVINWRNLGLTLGLLAVLGLIVWLSVLAHHHFITVPRALEMRHDDPLGDPGIATTQITGLGAEAVSTLIGDLHSEQSSRSRSKSLELLSGIVDPRVVPALAEALNDSNLGVQIAAISGLARVGTAKAAEALMKHIGDPNDLIGHRLIVALGLSMDEAQARRLLDQLKKSQGLDRVLMAWASGYALRRLELTAEFARIQPGPEYDSEEDADALQKKIDEEHAAIAALKDLETHARTLSELTSVDFSTWDYSHQIAFQILAVKGPKALRGMGRIDAPIKPRPELEGLDLHKKRPVPER